MNSHNLEGSMGFAVGDKVMHPSFGAGQITGEEHRELVDGFKHYYVIKVVGTTATAYVPISKMDDLGVRLVMSSSVLIHVLGTLRSVPSTLSNDHKKRQEGVQEKLQAGLPVPMAEAVRDLMWHRERRHLTQGDEALLKRGRERLAAEMALATDGDVVQAHELIDGTLRTAFALGFDELKAAQESHLVDVP
jgi:CarD family transcriptional regulator